MRDKFEEWAKDYVKGRDTNDRYTSPYTQAAWEAWQAAVGVLQEFPKGQPPRNAQYLFWSPGNTHAINQNAQRPYYKVDEFNDRWPRGMFQLPEAPYTRWMPLPAATE